MNIDVIVANKIATVVGSPIIVCGNSDYTITFNFDSEWDGYTQKTARFNFISGGQKKFVEVEFTGNVCNIPVLRGISKVDVGVYTEGLQTTTGAEIKCRRSILCGGGIVEENLFDNGRQAEYNEFWDKYQNFGGRDDYSMAFGGVGWNNKTFRPKYDIIGYNFSNIFNGCGITNLKECLNSCGIIFDTTAATVASNVFSNSSITDVPSIYDVASSTTLNWFYSAANVKNVEKYVFKKDGSQAWGNTFQFANSLQNIVFEGAIGKNGFNIQWSKFLSKDSILSILNCLQDKTGDTSAEWKIIIGATNKAKLTESELNIARNKNWSVE